MAKPSERDPYADFLRACSLLVVILYHWCFTILIWDDGITSATNPLAYQSGIWILSWVLQVVPIFFYIGSYLHLRSWERASARGETLPRFAFRQARSLFIPSMTLVVAWSVLGVLISTTFDLDWVVFAVFLVLSPLWFVLVYLFFVCAMPVTVWLHRRFDSLVLVVLAALAVIVDLLRLRFGVPAVEWVNMLFVWGFAYQLGYFHGRIAGLDDAPRDADGRVEWTYQTRRTRLRAWGLMLGGLVAVIGLVFSGVYPGAMVGVPDQFANMAPPTICLIALTIFQVGAVELARPAVLRALARRGLFARATERFTRFALPLFLFHTTGMAMALTIQWLIFGPPSTDPIVIDSTYWFSRPLAIIAPLLATLVLIYLFGRRFETPGVKPPPAETVQPLSEDAGGASGGSDGPPPGGLATSTLASTAGLPPVADRAPVEHPAASGEHPAAPEEHAAASAERPSASAEHAATTDEHRDGTWVRPRVTIGHLTIPLHRRPRSRR